MPAGAKVDGQLLLDRVNEELGGDPRHWTDVALVRNVGPLLTSVPLAGDNISNRGFNAIVFAQAGGPTHFLKVRPLTHDGFAREASVTVQLSADPRLTELVPGSRTFIAEPARVLALEFVDGLALDVLIRARNARSWHELATDVLRSTLPLREAIAELSGERGAVSVDGQSLQMDLDLLLSLGLDTVSGRATCRSTRCRHPANVAAARGFLAAQCPQGSWRMAHSRLRVLRRGCDAPVRRVSLHPGLR